MQKLADDLDQGELARLAATDDAGLATLYADPVDRAEALRVLLDGPAAAGPWTGPTGVVRLDVDLPDGGTEAASIQFAGSGISLVEADPQAVLRLPLTALVRLVTGQADGALLYLSGALDVIGDADLVLGIGAVLRTGAGRTLIDAAALDPVAVSDAIAGASTEHLASVMAGGFRPLVLAEVFRRLPEFLIAEKAERVRVAIAFEIGGRSDAGIDRYVVGITDGTCTVTAEASVDDPVDATLLLEGHEFLRLVLGHLNPVRGVLSGQIRVHGQVIKALGFNSVMKTPGS